MKHVRLSTLLFGVMLGYALLAFPASSDKPIVFAQLAIGGGYTCTLVVSNQLADPWHGTVTISPGASQPWIAPWAVNGNTQTGFSAFVLSLGGSATQTYVLTGDDVTRSGYLKIEAASDSSTLNLSVAYYFQYSDNGILVSTTGGPASVREPPFAGSSTKVSFPVQMTSTSDTGFACAVDESFASMSVTLLDSAGSVVDRKSMSCPGHLAVFFDQIFDLSERSSFSGSLVIDSAFSVYYTVLRLDKTANGFLLTSIPVTPVCEDTNVPSGLRALAVSNGRDPIFGVIPSNNIKSEDQVEFRAKCDPTFSSTSSDLRMPWEGATTMVDYDLFDIGFGSGGNDFMFKGVRPGRYFYAWRVHNKFGWSAWSDTISAVSQYLDVH